MPASETNFVSSHRSGNLYVWSTEFTGKTTGPQNYVLSKELQDASIYTVKPKNKSPVLFRWNVGHGAINSFAFSPDVTHIAIASQDGFLRVYNFKTQEFYGRMRSYFGGFLCVCWSPDGRYAVTGGEDDLLTVWSFEHRRVVVRGEGHKSYVSFVAFDPYTTVLPDAGFSSSAVSSSTPGCTAGDCQQVTESGTHSDQSSSASGSCLGRAISEAGDRERNMVAYRLGSVGQDTQLCLWDLSEDVLKPRRPFVRNRSRASRTSRPQSMAELTECGLPLAPAQEKRQEKRQGLKGVTSIAGGSPEDAGSRDSLPTATDQPNHDTAHGSRLSSTPVNTGYTPSATVSSLTENRSLQAHASPKRFPNATDINGLPEEEGKESSPSLASEQSSTEAGSGKKEKKSKKDREKKSARMREPVKKVMKFVGNFSGGNYHHQHAHRREVGTFESLNSDDIAPKMPEVNLIEPLVAKRISHERLTMLVFREDCIVTASQEGFVQTWVRPSTVLPDTVEDSEEVSAPSTTVNASAPSNPPGVSSLHEYTTVHTVYACMLHVGPFQYHTHEE